MPQTALITGARSGFGTALVLAFADAGWNVAATMRNPTAAPESLTARDSVLITRLDVTDPASIQSAVAETEDAFGPIDTLVNAAGFVVQGSLEEIALEDVRAQFETNVIGLTAVTQAVLPSMRERGSGHIFNFSSAGGLIGVPRIAAYSASKFAVEGLSESLARDLAHFGVQVTIVEPGVFETELGFSAVTPETPIDAYDPVAETLPDLFDWTPGNLAEAAAAIVGVAGDPHAPLRLYVGHGLNDVARQYEARLQEWRDTESLTQRTLAS